MTKKEFQKYSLKESIGKTDDGFSCKGGIIIGCLEDESFSSQPLILKIRSKRGWSFDFSGIIFANKEEEYYFYNSKRFTYLFCGIENVKL